MHLKLANMLLMLFSIEFMVFMMDSAILLMVPPIPPEDDAEEEDEAELAALLTLLEDEEATELDTLDDAAAEDAGSGMTFFGTETGTTGMAFAAGGTPPGVQVPGTMPVLSDVHLSGVAQSLGE